MLEFSNKHFKIVILEMFHFYLIKELQMPLKQ